MATSTCRAKNPGTCRIHGTNGQYAQLEALANQYARNKDSAGYMALREQMEALQDDDGTSPVAPDTSDMRIDSWGVSETELDPRTPNNVLSYTLNSHMHGFPQFIPSAVKILQDRGYSPAEIANIKHFRFRKDDETMRTVSKSEAMRAVKDYERENNVSRSYDQNRAFIDSQLGSTGEARVSNETALKFLSAAESYVKDDTVALPEKMPDKQPEAADPQDKKRHPFGKSVFDVLTRFKH